VQVVFDSDANGDGITDLVLGKATAFEVTAHVNNPGSLPAQVPVELTFEGASYRQNIQITASGTFDTKLVFNPSPPIRPTSTGITHVLATIDPDNIVVESDETNNRNSKTVDVKSTVPFRLAYVPLSNPIADAAFLQDAALARQKSDEFLLTTYPLADSQFSSFLTTPVPADPSGASCISLDCPPTLGELAAVARNATTTINDFLTLRLVGFLHGADRVVGIVPKNYFSLHGLCGYTGLTMKTVGSSIAAEGFWTAVAHEIGHTYGLPLVGSEEYSSCPVKTNGNIASAGYWVAKSKPIDPLANGCDPANGVDLNCIRCFMGTAAEANGVDPRNGRWIELPDFDHLFQQLLVNKTDPFVLLVTGTLSQDNRLSLGQWAFGAGVADDVADSDVVVDMLDINGQKLAQIPIPISFTWFLEGFGAVDTQSTIFARQISLLPGAVRLQFTRGNTVLLTQNLITKLVSDAINLVPDVGFVGPALQRRMALQNMIGAMDSMMAAQNFMGARQKLSTSFTNAVANWLLDDYPLNNATGISKKQVMSLIGAMANQIGSP